MHAAVLSPLRVRNLELIKWAGLVTMLMDHYGLFLLGQDAGVWRLAGGATVPLFAIALGAGLARRELSHGYPVAYRVLLWAIVAQGAVLLVRPFWPGNILFTIWGSLALFLALEDRADPRDRWAYGLAGLALVLVSEGSFVAAGCFLGALGFLRFGSWQYGLLFLGSVCLLVPLNGIGALLAVPLVVLLDSPRADLPRVPRAFYVAYVIQWPLLAAMAYFAART